MKRNAPGTLYRLYGHKEIVMLVETEEETPRWFVHTLLNRDGDLFIVVSDTEVLEEDRFWRGCCEKVNL